MIEPESWCILCHRRPPKRPSTLCASCLNLGVRPEDVLEEPIPVRTKKGNMALVRVRCKRCSTCGKRKEWTDFVLSASESHGVTGLLSRCRLCKGDENDAYRGVVVARGIVAPAPDPVQAPEQPDNLVEHMPLPLLRRGQRYRWYERLALHILGGTAA